MIQVFDENGFLLFSTSDYFGIIDILLMQYYDPLEFNLTINDNDTIKLNDKILTVKFTDPSNNRSDIDG